jgi:hypothetical protein
MNSTDMHRKLRRALQQLEQRVPAPYVGDTARVVDELRLWIASLESSAWPSPRWQDALERAKAASLDVLLARASSLAVSPAGDDSRLTSPAG